MDILKDNPLLDDDDGDYDMMMNNENMNGEQNDEEEKTGFVSFSTFQNTTRNHSIIIMTI